VPSRDAEFSFVVSVDYKRNAGAALQEAAIRLCKLCLRVETFFQAPRSDYPCRLPQAGQATSST
jgi:hypothetical protein